MKLKDLISDIIYRMENETNKHKREQLAKAYAEAVYRALLALDQKTKETERSKADFLIKEINLLDNNLES